MRRGILARLSSPKFATELRGSGHDYDRPLSPRDERSHGPPEHPSDSDAREANGRYEEEDGYSALPGDPRNRHRRLAPALAIDLAALGQVHAATLVTRLLEARYHAVATAATTRVRDAAARGRSLVAQRRVSAICPKPYGVLAEIELVPACADWSSRGNAARCRRVRKGDRAEAWSESRRRCDGSRGEARVVPSQTPAS